MKKTELMLQNNFTWRKQVGADSILDDYQIPEVMHKYFPGGVCGQDKDGSVIWIDPSGMIDMRGTYDIAPAVHLKTVITINLFVKNI